VCKILIDTNILIFREDFREIPKEVQDLLKLLNRLGCRIVIHPYSKDEIKRDKNKERRKIMLSKIETYQSVKDPPLPDGDKKFVQKVGKSSKINDYIDNCLLYCIYRDVVDFLITQDEDIHKKAVRLGVQERVLRVEEAVEYFKKKINIQVPQPPQLKEEFCYNLDINDPFFDSLKSQYPDFLNWWKKICKEGRKAWVYYLNNKIKAILILKPEEEAIYANPPLPKKKRLKICTLKVDPPARGYKLGELFIKIATHTALQYKAEEIYLTHFVEKNDFLVSLLEEFNFHEVSEKPNGEKIFLKPLIPKSIPEGAEREIFEKYYPLFYDGEKVNKFIIPIQSRWFKRLFPEYTYPQPFLVTGSGELLVEGNTIKKVYLSHAKLKDINKGDIVLFYRSQDIKGITSLGVVERVHVEQDYRKIVQITGKRTVYSEEEIRKFTEKKPVTVIFFWWHLHFENPVKFKKLKKEGILNFPPLKIMKISHEDYLKIKEWGNIDERFDLHQILLHQKNS